MIETLTGEITADGAELKAATDIRVKEIVAVQIAILEREMKKGASMLQLKNAGRAAQALQVLVQASAFGPAGASRLTALLQCTHEESDSRSDAPAAGSIPGT